MLNLLVSYVCTLFGCWAYSFQTFAALEVLGATKMNQIEINVRDHVHGRDSVESLFHRVRYQQILLTDTTTITWDTASAQHARITPTVARAFADPTSVRSGEWYSLLLYRTNSGGGHTFGAAYEWPLDTAPTISTTSGDSDLLTLYCPDGAKLLGMHSAKGYKF